MIQAPGCGACSSSGSSWPWRLAAVADARPAVTEVEGKATFPVTPSGRRCIHRPAVDVLRESCTPDFGTYAGTPGDAGASIGWARRYEVVNGGTTGKGIEKGILKLNFGGGKVLHVAFGGKLRPVGAQTNAKGKIRSTGKCTVKKKTGFGRSLAGAAPKCTYSLVITRRDATYTSIVFSLVAAV